MSIDTAFGLLTTLVVLLAAEAVVMATLTLADFQTARKAKEIRADGFPWAGKAEGCRCSHRFLSSRP